MFTGVLGSFVVQVRLLAGCIWRDSVWKPSFAPLFTGGNMSWAGGGI